VLLSAADAPFRGRVDVLLSAADASSFRGREDVLLSAADASSFRGRAQCYSPLLTLRSEGELSATLRC